MRIADDLGAAGLPPKTTRAARARPFGFRRGELDPTPEQEQLVRQAIAGEELPNVNDRELEELLYFLSERRKGECGRAQLPGGRAKVMNYGCSIYHMILNRIFWNTAQFKG
jgi:hypothetical protein